MAARMAMEMRECRTGHACGAGSRAAWDHVCLLLQDFEVLLWQFLRAFFLNLLILLTLTAASEASWGHPPALDPPWFHACVWGSAWKLGGDLLSNICAQISSLKP